MAEPQSPNDIDEFFSTARTSARDEALALSQHGFREYLYDLGDDVLAPYRGMSYEEFTADRYQAPFLRELLDYWRGLYDEPFTGITTDGRVREGLYAPAPLAADAARAAGDPDPSHAARRVLDLLTPEAREQVQYPIDAPEWRSWSNPEFVFFRTGLRLEDQRPEVVAAVHEVLRASLSETGYARVREAMNLNGFLGELVDLPTIMNPESYWFALYGDPEQEAWGWQLFGHHVALNFVSVAGRHVLAPVFIGAEPALTEGEREPLFDEREQLALELAASLAPDQRARAVVYDSVLDPAMPEGRLHPADERHVAGAFRDNRVVPYEGIPASALDAGQRALLVGIVADFFALLQPEQRDLAVDEVVAHLDETHLAWYGATDGSQPFYFRVHGPTVLAELDHHAGVWLGNRLPERFHVHTTLRLPNGGDYGKALIALS
ncbi:DUF3500 domain-containing protein [Leucobacter sp. HY1910]